MSSDQFKAVGIATVKGIGRGSKALGKAGYKTYKKNEAKRQGKEYVEPASDNDGKSTTTDTEKREYEPYVARPLPSKETLQSYQPPPRRNVGAYRPSEGKYVTPQNTQSTTQTQSYQQPQQYQQPQHQPSQPYQQPQQYQEPAQQTAYSDPPQYLQPTQSVSQPMSQPVQQMNQPPPPPRPAQPAPSTQAYGPNALNTQQAHPTPFAQAQGQNVPNPQQPQQSYVQPSQPVQTYPQQAQPAQAQFQEPQSHVQGEAPPPAYGQHDQIQQYGQIPASYGQQAQVPVSQPVPGQVQAPPSLPGRGSTIGASVPQPQPAVGNYTPVEQPINPSMTPPVDQQDTSQTQTEIPKRPLPDPTSFPPPPTRRVQSPDVTGSSHKSGAHSKASPKRSEPLHRHSNARPGESSPATPTASSNYAEHNHLQPPALPSRTSANSVTSDASTKKKFDMNAFPPPPSIPRPTVEEKKEKYHRSPSIVSDAVSATKELENFEDNAPPMPSRPSQRTPSSSSIVNSVEEAPPMPKRPLQSTNSASSIPISTGEAKEAIQKKKPPPKPVKKTKNLSDNQSASNPPETPNQGVQSELENMFKRMNANKFNSESEAVKKEPPVVKPKPAKQVSPPPVKPKPLVKPKPEVKPKPVASPSGPKLDNTTPAESLVAGRVDSPTPPPVPKPRNYKRAAAPIPTVQQQGPPNLDLELGTQWFASTEGLVLPKSLQGLNYQTSYSYSTSGGSQIWNRVVTVRLKDLSIVSYKLVWNANDVASVAVTIDRFVPSPISTIPSKQELVASHEQFGEYVASWSEHHKGQQVGSGECWDLAKFALEKGCGKHAFVSQYYTHGYPILQIKNSGSGVEFMNGLQQLDEIRRGDILQFKSCTFFNPVTGVTQTVGAPDHTSIVVKNDGTRLDVVEQNVNNVRKVRDGEYILKNLTAGEVFVYRPMPTEWAGSL